MKKITALLLCVLMVSVCLAACDPVYPTDSLKAELSKELSVGDTAEIKLTYPNKNGSAVIGWKDTKVEIISGDDIISVSGLNVSAIKAGTATLKITVTGDIAEDSKKNGLEEKTYSTELEIVVK